MKKNNTLDTLISTLSSWQLADSEPIIQHIQLICRRGLNLAKKQMPPLRKKLKLFY